MRKVLIIGLAGAGKTMLARRIGTLLDLPLIHFDEIYWRPGWRPMPQQEWEQTLQEIVLQDAWVMDGLIFRTLEIGLAACDTVIFLDVPWSLCFWRVLQRVLPWKSRPEVAEGCSERLRLDRRFIRWFWNFPRQQRPWILARLETLPPETNIHILRCRQEVEDFLARLSASTA